MRYPPIGCQPRETQTAIHESYPSLIATLEGIKLAILGHHQLYMEHKLATSTAPVQSIP